MKFATIRIGSVLAALGGCFGLEFVSNRFLSGYASSLVFYACIYITLAVSLNLINGITGQFSIGHYAFFQVGAYAAGGLSKAYFQSQPLQPFAWIIVMVVMGAIAAAFAGLIVGLPSLRLRGDYLAIVTLGFGEIIRIATNNIIYVGGAGGLNVVPTVQSIFLTSLLAVSCIALCRNLLKTAHGLSFLSVREDEIASNAMGVNTTKTKVMAFVIGSAFAGAAGALYAHQLGYISPDQFKMDGSFIVLTMVIFGGTGSITGSIFAAVLLFTIPEALRNLHTVPFAAFISALLSLMIMVGSLKWVLENYHGEAKQKSLRYLGVVIGSLVVFDLIRISLDLIPVVKSHVAIDGSQLRLVIYAATLISLMMLRPQGVFGHYEFSWNWLKKVFSRRQAENGAVA